MNTSRNSHASPVHEDAPSADRSPQEVRAFILGMLSEEFSISSDAVDVNQHFDTMGLDSMSIYAMTCDLSEYVGHDLSATLLWEHPSVAELSEALGNAPTAVSLPPGLLVENQEGTETPLFFMPGVAGFPTSFTKISRRLGEHRPAYGLLLPSRFANAEPESDLAAMASEVLTRLLAVQPEGPYCLFGYSLEGSFAFEVACQLQASGREVAFLGFLDTYAPGFFPKRALRKRACKHLTQLARRPWRERLHYAREQWESRGEAQPAPVMGDISPGARHLEIQRACGDALRSYQPSYFFGDITLLRADTFDGPSLAELHGWPARISGDVHVAEVAGNHHELLRNSLLPRIAQHIRVALRRSENSRRAA